MSEVTIYDSVLDATDEYNTSPGVVFISDLVGYAFFIHTTGIAVFKKTTDGGATWSSSTYALTLQTDCWSIAVWYDRWTAGNNGTKIHFAFGETGGDRRGSETYSADDCGVAGGDRSLFYLVAVFPVAR